MSTKSREARARRAAKAFGLMLVKRRRRDQLAEDYGRYVLVADCRGNRLGRYGGQAAVSEFHRTSGIPLDAIEGELGL